jgi:hypothetical protein
VIAMKNKITPFLAAFSLVIGLAAGSARAATISVINLDGAGEGFNDATGVAPVGGNYGTTIGQQRLIAFQYAAAIWAACLQSAVPVIVNAQMNPLSCTATSAVLGSAGATTVFRDFTGAPLAATWYPQALANALHGSDLDPGTADISATFNSNIGNAGCLTGTFWYYGLDGNAPLSTIDFVAVVLHELGHGLGFQTFVSQTGVKLAGFNDDYMVFLENHGAVPADYPSMSDAQRAAGNIADPNLHWTGPLVTARGLSILSGGTSGGHVRMHGPNPYQPGSSVSHWSTALSPNELMEPVYTTPIHDPGLAWTLMDEIGWTLLPKVTDGCDGAKVDLASADGTYTPNAGDDSQDRGVFVTALKDFTLCSVGIEGDFIPGETFTAKVYAATGTSRGALLATSGNVAVEFAGTRTHYIPISYTLKDCKEYDIAVTWQHATTWPWWSELNNTHPYDVGGVIRVRDGESVGVAGNFALAHFTLQGSSAAPQNQSDVVNTNTCDYPNEHGAFVTPRKTVSLCKLGIVANFPSAPTTVRAYVYHSSSKVRGTLVAEGTVTVPLSGASQTVSVPVNAVLVEGQQYDIGFVFGGPIQLIRECRIQVFPWQFGDLWSFDGQEVSGGSNDANSTVPTFKVSWDEGSGGQLLDLVGPWHNDAATLANLTQDITNYGLYVTATKNSEVYSLGWYADVPAGQVIGANVYAAVGNARGALLSSGTILSGAGGKRWHDIPLSSSLVSGQDYDIEIDIGQVDAWDCWTDLGDANGPPLPYNAYGILNVRSGETSGDATNFCIIDMRLGACATTVTGVGGPTLTPKFTLSSAFPNPFSGSARLGYELDKASTVSVAIYDVAGRKVADVMRSKSLPAGPGQLNIDAGKLASGVYFVKLSTPSKSVTRKITIVR